jgi:transcriptional regulator with XRE-family HTH domain
MADKNKITIYDVAKKAGVSRQTVSRVLNNRQDVSAETRKRVQEIIEGLSYHPSAIARSLSGNLQEEFQQRAVGVEERPQEVIDGEGDVQVGHIEHVFGDIVDQVVHADLAAGGAETGFAGEGDAMLILAAGAEIAGIAAIRVTAEQHTLNDVPDVSLLIEGSPAIDAGTDVGDMGRYDFFGNPIPFGSAYDIGAYEY